MPARRVFLCTCATRCAAVANERTASSNRAADIAQKTLSSPASDEQHQALGALEPSDLAVEPEPFGPRPRVRHHERADQRQRGREGHHRPGERLEPGADLQQRPLRMEHQREQVAQVEAEDAEQHGGLGEAVEGRVQERAEARHGAGAARQLAVEDVAQPGERQQERPGARVALEEREPREHAQHEPGDGEVVGAHAQPGEQRHQRLQRRVRAVLQPALDRATRPGARRAAVSGVPLTPAARLPRARARPAPAPSRPVSSPA